MFVYIHLNKEILKQGKMVHLNFLITERIGCIIVIRVIIKMPEFIICWLRISLWVLAAIACSPTELASVKPLHNGWIITAQVIRNITTVKTWSFLPEICKQQQQQQMAALKYGLFRFGCSISNVHINRSLGLTNLPSTANCNVNRLTNKGKPLKCSCQ